MMDIKEVPFHWFINFLIKKLQVESLCLHGQRPYSRRTIRATRNKFAIKNENISNKELAEELQKPIIKSFKKRKVQ